MLSGSVFVNVDEVHSLVSLGSSNNIQKHYISISIVNLTTYCCSTLLEKTIYCHYTLTLSYAIFKWILTKLSSIFDLN